MSIQPGAQDERTLVRRPARSRRSARARDAGHGATSGGRTLRRGERPDRGRFRRRLHLRLPSRRVQELETASDAEIAEVEIAGAGLALHWPARDADLSLSGLLRGTFGTGAWRTDLARRTTSPAKAAAARANGAKGGRPRKGG